MNRRLLVLTSLIAFASPCRAASFVWSFSSANPTCDAVPANPVNLCNSDYNAPTATFADTTATFDITARGYDLGTGTSPLTLVVGTTMWTVPSMSPNNDLLGQIRRQQPGRRRNRSRHRESQHRRQSRDREDELHPARSDEPPSRAVRRSGHKQSPEHRDGDGVGQQHARPARAPPRDLCGPRRRWRRRGHVPLRSLRRSLSHGVCKSEPSGPNNVLIQSGFAAEIPTTTTTSSTTTTSTTTTTTTSTTPDNEHHHLDDHQHVDNDHHIDDDHHHLELHHHDDDPRSLPVLRDQAQDVRDHPRRLGAGSVRPAHRDRPLPAPPLCAGRQERDEEPDAPTHPEHLVGHLVSGSSVKVLTRPWRTSSARSSSTS